MKNKKGEKIISVYWFVILFLVAGAMVYMVSSFYGKPYDLREIEAELLADKAADCFSYGGYLRNNVLVQTFRDNFLENCGITFDTEDIYGWQDQGQYFLQAEIYDFDTYSEENVLFSFSGGNENLKEFCSLQGENSPVCFEKELYTIDEQGNSYIIKITSIVRKTEKNA